MAGFLHPSRMGYRLLVLFFNCMLTFGSYFCFDMPSVLEDLFEKEPHNLSPTQYNLLYAIYAWTNAAMVIVAGFLVDKLGNRLGVILFSALCLTGAITFALGVHYNIYGLMLAGRLIFGSGNGSLTIVQNKITAQWFGGKELAMAFGFTLAFSRLGSVLNFLLTSNFASKHGLEITLWGGAILCAVSFLSAFVVTFLDSRGMRILGKTELLANASKQLKFTDIKNLEIRFWLVCAVIVFFYNSVFPFVADASSFIQDKYGLKPNKASDVAGSVYYVSLGISPFMGRLVDSIGSRGYIAVIFSLLTLPVFCLLGFGPATISAYIPVLWFGLTYSVMAATIWPSIPLVVPQASVGTAMGVATSLQMIGIGICNLVVGVLRGKDIDKQTNAERLTRWKHVMILMLSQIVICVVFALWVNLADARKNRVLNKSGMKKKNDDLDEKNDEEERKTVHDGEIKPLLSSSEGKINN
eukprot:m.4334 g.4334  ORF g.4334 m.4334 type:complete len:468 (-) comp4465_c0_seq1:140-1543(-)